MNFLFSSSSENHLTAIRHILSSPAAFGRGRDSYDIGTSVNVVPHFLKKLISHAWHAFQNRQREIHLFQLYIK